MKLLNLGLVVLCAAGLTGCGSLHPSGPRVSPSFVPLNSSISNAQASTTKARKSTQNTADAIKQGQAAAAKLAADATAADKPVIEKLQSDLTLAQQQNDQTKEQLDATVDSLSKALLNSDSLEKQVVAQTAELNANIKQVAVDKIQIKKLSGEVWIYKGGFCVLILVAVALLLLHMGILTKLFSLAMGFAFPLSWIILGAAILTLPALLFGLLWKLLP